VNCVYRRVQHLNFFSGMRISDCDGDRSSSKTTCPSFLSAYLIFPLSVPAGILRLICRTTS